jgi:hypothetical protein
MTEAKPKENAQSYFEKRCSELGVTKANNKIDLFTEDENTGQKTKKTFPIFTEDRQGNIDILIYTLKREIFVFDHPKATPEKPNINNERTQVFKIKRLHPDNVKGDQKYVIPKGQGTHPFIPPTLLEKYEKKEKIKTLALTEGAFKAWKGALHGADIVGLTSITHYKEKDKGELHSDIREIIKVCQVENVIMLYDGDCLDISLKALREGEDLYKRPSSFFYSAKNINNLLKDDNVNFWFAHVKSESEKEQPKGLDDLLIVKKGHEKAVVTDLNALSTNGNYFTKLEITHNQNKLVRYLNIDKVENFYEYHSKHIGFNEFLYHGTKYQYNNYDNKLEVKMPAEAQRYYRVGNDYYEIYERPNKYGDLEEHSGVRLKSTIVDDHGKNFVKFIPKFKDFVNVPDHVNYQRIIHNCYNSYSPFIHKSEQGDCSHTLNFLKHIFEEQYEMGLDYMQLLYQQPTQKLPILCLVSKENKTGKSTFAKYLRLLFSNNATIIGNAEIENSFNAHLSSKLVIAIDESFIEKKLIIEKIKNMATADTMPMQKKGKDIVDIDFFAKIILLSNNVENFVTATEEDIRYWVREIKKPEKEMTNLLIKMSEEIPSFLDFLEKRKLSTKEETRAWFATEDILTEAFRRVVDASKPSVVKTMEHEVREMFLEYGNSEILLSLNDIKDMFFRNNVRIDKEYISRSIDNHMQSVKKYRNEKGLETTKRYKIPVWREKPDMDGNKDFVIETEERVGRPYIFRMGDFLTEKQIKQILEKADEILEELPF